MEPDLSELSLYVPSLTAGSPLPDSITLDQRWEEAEEVFASAQEAALQMLVIFGVPEGDQHCLEASAVVTAVSVEGKRTRIHFKERQPIPARPIAPCLLDDAAEEVLEAADLAEARVVFTPLFLLQEPKTFLLTWNPLKEVPMAAIQEVRARMMAGEPCSWNWTCRSVNKVNAGDRFLMLRQGPLPRGIVGSGWIRTNAWFGEEDVPYVDILWRRLVDPNRPLDPTTIRGAEQVHWSPYGSGIELPEEVFEAVWAAWDAHSANDRATDHQPEAPAQAAIANTAAPSPGEAAEDAASSTEGRLIETWSSRRERDPANRALCLTAHGYRCAVCAMSFAEEYGVIGEGFIHIHHEQPLASSDDTVGAKQDPVTLMKPVCPNCHAMLHRGLNAALGEVRSIAELKALREQARAMPAAQ
ncbi:MAG: hypothetical protein IAE77_28915 [Prosthecobacter sp.]|uniref:HNH endonuclease n=1 Tax=Prosthecobacter sp. TaxID=1965333 RepID=UPI0019DEAA5C|nr:hypothetical protein [Prosthecobacter sp.]MBE2287512.1 hypothetical protein [Prosthecobacter sp.]